MLITLPHGIPNITAWSPLDVAYPQYSRFLYLKYNYYFTSISTVLYLRYNYYSTPLELGSPFRFLTCAFTCTNISYITTTYSRRWHQLIEYKIRIKLLLLSLDIVYYMRLNQLMKSWNCRTVVSSCVQWENT